MFASAFMSHSHNYKSSFKHCDHNLGRVAATLSLCIPWLYIIGDFFVDAKVIKDMPVNLIVWKIIPDFDDLIKSFPY